MVLDTLEPLTRLSRDLKKAAVTLSPDEARYLVDLYYLTQEDRKRLDNQGKAMERSETPEPHTVLDWFFGNVETLENDIRRALDTYSDSHPIGRWAKSIHGIGPVIAAGLLAHIDIRKAPTVGHIWRFAGLDPSVSWGKGQKRPWNAELKTLCWKIGQSFMKQSGNPKDFYGHLYVEYKARIAAKNEAGDYAEQAAGYLKAKNYGKETEAYKAYSEGRLPKAQIDARARRWAVKLFLAHLHAVWYEVEFGCPPPKPYVLEHLGHAHEIKPPNWPME